MGAQGWTPEQQAALETAAAAVQARNDRIGEMRAAGQSNATIAREMGISEERVRQIGKRAAGVANPRERGARLLLVESRLRDLAIVVAQLQDDLVARTHALDVAGGRIDRLRDRVIHLEARPALTQWQPDHRRVKDGGTRVERQRREVRA